MNGPDRHRTEFERRRYDGGPAPSRNTGISMGDAKAAAEKAAREQTCDHCGYDPGGASATREELTRVESRLVHSCSRHQTPPVDPVALCPDCLDDHDPEAEFVERQRERDEVVVRFECDIIETAEEPDVQTIEEEVQTGWEDGEPVYETEELEVPGQDTRARIPVECDCGAAIKAVYD